MNQTNHEGKTEQKEIAVIGAGYWGKNLVRNFKHLGALKTICDGDKASQKLMKESYPEIDVTDDFITVLNDPEIRAIVIATPAALHYHFADKALRAGKDVFVEKPLSLTYKDGEKLVRMAAEKNKIVFVGHILQYHAAVVALKEFIKDGRIGRLQYIYSRRLSLGKIRREENILWSFAPHDISVILGITGEEPCFIDSVGNNFLHARIPDVTMTNLKFPSGIGAHIFVSWLNPYKEQKLVIVGSEGMLVFDDTEPVEKKLVHYPHTIKWQNGFPVPDKAEGIPVDLSQTWKEPLLAECEAFLTAIETRTPPITSGDEGLRVLKILETSQQSLEHKDSFNASPFTPDASSSVPHSSLLTPSVSVHETAVIDEGCEIGEGTKIWHFSHLLTGSRLGENCNIGQNVVIGPGVTIGNGCKIQNNVSVYNGVHLEDDVFCGPSMVFTNVYNPRAAIKKMDELRPTLVKKGATIGANATIVCGVTIGQCAFIGAGSVVTNDAPDYALMVGNPACRIGWMCRCGERLDGDMKCAVCGKGYEEVDGVV
ncbi:MAG: Gfo/Idh/MocA family oxidoreductase, partial [Deltaproteobacteria bacterium]|nr:Gfo/Idh/MocA family oxidoreductase [Deltaproteobacteria bacterium]